MKCAHCPVAGPMACHGESTPRMCQLTDPGHPDHDARYGPLLVEMAAGGRDYPSPARQAANLARSLWDWAVSGFSMAPAAEVGRREAICRACPQYDAEAARCRLCGCYTAAKLRLRTERCPEGRW